MARVLAVNAMGENTKENLAQGNEIKKKQR